MRKFSSAVSSEPLSDRYDDARASIVLILLPAAALLALAAFQLAAVQSFAPPALIGDRTIAAIDLWSIQHFCSGILIGSLLVGVMPRVEIRELAFSVGLIALGWEALELMAEAGWFGVALSGWKDGFEHWSNRLLADPLLVVSGALVARRYRKAWRIVVVPAAIWLALNAASPSSMYVQRLLFPG